jgi:hypothetical protein
MHVYAFNIAKASMEICWELPWWPGAPTPAIPGQYKIRYRKTGFLKPWKTAGPFTTSTSYRYCSLISPLDPGTSYRFRVKVKYGTGAFQLFGSEITATTLP